VDANQDFIFLGDWLLDVLDLDDAFVIDGGFHLFS
jgi:hypothetical protein